MAGGLFCSSRRLLFSTSPSRLALTPRQFAYHWVIITHLVVGGGGAGGSNRIRRCGQTPLGDNSQAVVVSRALYSSLPYHYERGTDYELDP